MNENDRFEIIGDLYHARFHRLRPGKSEPMETGRSSSDEENRVQFLDWFRSGVALEDALREIKRLRDAKDAHDRLCQGENTL